MVTSHTSLSEARGDDPSGDLPAGTQIDDYRIVRTLGRGGMGTVFEAVHQIIERRIALKVLHRDLSARGDAVARFVREARAVNRTRHPGIVDVFGFGRTPDGRAYLAMELLEGETLRHRLARERLSLTQTSAILDRIARALSAAHAAGIVHRDLKPDNVFMLATGELKLLDFGIAKLSTPTIIEGAVDVTQPGVLIGTPQYIAPEQARGLATSSSADIYALGVLAFEMLTGRPPFLATDALELLAKHITLQAPAPSDLDPALPPAADHLVAAMLAKDPDQRPSADGVCELLLELPTLEPSYDRFAGGQDDSSAADTRLLAAVPDVRSRRAFKYAIASLVMIAVAVRGIVWWRDTAPPTAGKLIETAAPTIAPLPVPHPPMRPATSSVAEAPIADTQQPRPATRRLPPTLSRPKPRPAPPKPKTVEPAPVQPAPAQPVVDDDAIRNPYEK
ncbi:MAG: serine/threonine-protein kinase [Deltaproteobacteria bacterium]